jgi:hypothetical protein
MCLLFKRNPSVSRGSPYKEVLRWAKKGTRALDRVEFLMEVQREKGVRRPQHRNPIERADYLNMYSVVKHWENIVERVKRESQRRMGEV